MNLTLIGRWLALVTVLLMAMNAAAAADDRENLSKEEREKAERLVRDFLARHNAPARLSAITDDAVLRAFPSYAAFAVIFPQYPVARLAPPPFKAQNLFLVDKFGALEHLTDVKELEKFFAKNLTAKDEASLKTAVEAWLRLAQEFHQDLFYKFAFDQNSLKITGDKGEQQVSARVTVAQGGKGDLSVVLTFDERGKLVKAAEASTLKPGVRPICQATKLLDADPLVRRMAEQDLLVMGRACREYLEEQRVKAPPELAQAIDRVWQRIVVEGW
jgi:hypothetical protein